MRWRGADIRTVQEQLGHSGVRTTEIVSHVLNRSGRAVKSSVGSVEERHGSRNIGFVLISARGPAGEAKYWEHKKHHPWSRYLLGRSGCGPLLTKLMLSTINSLLIALLFLYLKLIPGLKPIEIWPH